MLSACIQTRQMMTTEECLSVKLNAFSTFDSNLSNLSNDSNVSNSSNVKSLN